jgi:outer membrane protein TolC
VKPWVFVASLLIWLAFAPFSHADVVASGGMVSFEDALAQILARSTGIATQEANAGAVRARNLPIRLSFAPSLSFDASAKRSGGAFYDTPVNERQAEGTLAMNLWHWGADAASWRAATQDELEQAALVEDAYLRAQDGGATALVTLIQRRFETQVAADVVKANRESLAIARQRYARGYLPLQETQKVEVDLANSEALLADAQSAEAVAAADLTALLGHARVATEWPWTAAFARLGDRLPRVAEALGQGAGGDRGDGAELARALGQRPDWRAAQARLDAESARLSRGWRLLGPSLDGRASYGYAWNDRNYVYGSSLGGTEWAASLAVTLPLFDHLQIYSDARAQAFVRGAAEQALEQVRRDARADWESARQVFVTGLATARSRDRTLGISRKLYSDALSRFKAGRINADDLALEQRRVFDSERLAVQGWASLHLAFERLCKARGLRLVECRID